MTKSATPRTTTLQKIARDLLDEHKTVNAAAPAFAAMIGHNAQLRLALATFYLEQIGPGQSKPPHSRRRPGPHRTPLRKTPTPEQKAGALRAERSYADAIFARKLRGGRPLGQVRVHELRAIAETSAATATSFLSRGYEDAVETIACTMLSQYCVAADPFAFVKDTIKASVATSIFDKARIAAAETIRDGSAKMAKDLLAIAAKQQITLEQSQ